MERRIFDLVKVIVPDDRYFGAIGIITEVDKDVNGNELYEILFVGKKHNEESQRHGDLFYGHELEGI